MTQQGTVQLYEYLGAAWPLVIKPGVDEQWRRNKIRELFRTYLDYTDTEVMEAYQKWTEENEKFPTVKNIISEIRWLRAKKQGGKTENEELHQAPVWIDGQEQLIMHGGKIAWKRVDFVNQIWNPEKLQPEEWERRFKATRARAIKAETEARR